MDNDDDAVIPDEIHDGDELWKWNTVLYNGMALVVSNHGWNKIANILSSQFPQVGQHAFDCEKDRLRLSEMKRGSGPLSGLRTDASETNGN